MVEEENGLLEEKKAEYENTVVLLQEEQLVQSKQTRNLEKYSSKKALLTQKLEECETRIRDLGVIPDEAFEKYSAMSSKSVY